MKAFWSGGLVFKLTQSRHFGNFIPQLQATSGPRIFPARGPRTQGANPDVLLFSRLVVSNSVTSWTAVRQVSLSLTISWSLLKLMSVDSMLFNHLIL